MPKHETSLYRGIWLSTRSLPAPCEHCGEMVTEFGNGKRKGIIHHVDGDRSNNDGSNLALMHGGCHMTHHKLGGKNPHGGQPRSEQTRRKISASKKGKKLPPRTPEHIAALVASRKSKGGT